MQFASSEFVTSGLSEIELNALKAALFDLICDTVEQTFHKLIVCLVAEIKSGQNFGK